MYTLYTNSKDSRLYTSHVCVMFHTGRVLNTSFVRFCRTLQALTLVLPYVKYNIMCLQEHHVDLLQLMINAESANIEQSPTKLTMTYDKEEEIADFSSDTHLAGDEGITTSLQYKRVLAPQVLNQVWIYVW